MYWMTPLQLYQLEGYACNTAILFIGLRENNHILLGQMGSGLHLMFPTLSLIFLPTAFQSQHLVLLYRLFVDKKYPNHVTQNLLELRTYPALI